MPQLQRGVDNQTNRGRFRELPIDTERATALVSLGGGPTGHARDPKRPIAGPVRPIAGFV